MSDEIQTTADPAPPMLEDRVNFLIDAVLDHITFQNERHNRLARPLPDDHARLTNLVTKLKALKSA